MSPKGRCVSRRWVRADAGFPSYDGTLIAYRTVGTGQLLVCVPGGPARASVYFGGLGGLDTHRTLLLFDNRGIGESGDSDHDPRSYRADRLADDVEALRAHLGLETFALLGHSGGAQIALWYAAAHPERLESLILLNGATCWRTIIFPGSRRTRRSSAGNWRG